MKRHEVQILLAVGQSERRVAKLAGVPRTSVQRIAKEEPVADAGDKRLRVVRGAGRPSEVARFRSHVLEILKEEPDLLSVEVLRRLREVGYAGGKSAAYDFIAMLRAPKAPPLVRFEGLAGEFSQHDFGSVAVTYDDGTREQVHFFASRLKFSGASGSCVGPRERRRVEVEPAAVEVDRVAEPLATPEAACHALDPLDFGVHRLGQCIRLPAHDRVHDSP